MPTYTVLCDECDASYDIYIELNMTHDRPEHCSYCGAELKSKNVVSEEDEGFDEDEWEKLIEDDWKEDDDSGY
jgi:NAD-dependent SIR2 family protein deacetylase